MLFLSSNLRLPLIPIIPRHPFIIRSINNPHAFIAFLFIPIVSAMKFQPHYQPRSQSVDSTTFASALVPLRMLFHPSILY